MCLADTNHSHQQTFSALSPYRHRVGCSGLDTTFHHAGIEISMSCVRSSRMYGDCFSMKHATRRLPSTRAPETYGRFWESIVWISPPVSSRKQAASPCPSLVFKGSKTRFPDIHPVRLSRNLMGKRPHPIGKAGHLIGNARHPIGKSSHPIEKSRHPIGRHCHPMGKTRLPIGKARLPIGKDRLLIGKARHPIGKNRLPIEIPRHPMGKSRPPMIRL